MPRDDGTEYPLPVAAREADELAAIADDHDALIARAVQMIELRQVLRWGSVTWPAERGLLARMSNHDLMYLINNDPRGY